MSADPVNDVAVGGAGARAPRAFAGSDTGKTMDMLLYERNTFRKYYKEQLDRADRLEKTVSSLVKSKHETLLLLVKWSSPEKKDEAKEKLWEFVISWSFQRTVSTKYTTKERCRKEARGKKSRDAWVKPGKVLKDGTQQWDWVAWVESETEEAPFYDKAVLLCREWFSLNDDGEFVLKTE